MRRGTLAELQAVELGIGAATLDPVREGSLRAVEV
jgi:hypothetical protein